MNNRSFRGQVDGQVDRWTMDFDDVDDYVQVWSKPRPLTGMRGWDQMAFETFEQEPRPTDRPRG